jgi:SAM-dependent methyltransferase
MKLTNGGEHRVARANLRGSVPWWLRIGTKVALAALPIPYGLWKRVRVFELGGMDDPQYAFNAFVEFARAVGVLEESTTAPRIAAAGEAFNVVELGPGDSLFTAVVAKALGASRTWLVDSGPFATTPLASYLELSHFLRQKGLALPIRDETKTLPELLRQCDGEYLTGGVASLAQIPSETVSFCFSNAVLEHIPRNEFETLARELYRLLKPGGVSIHRVDLSDHLGGGLNNLRFSEKLWEGNLFRRSGFYTNRLRFGELLQLFRGAGFKCSVPRVVRWDTLPTPRESMDPSFERTPDDDLLVMGFDVVLTRA